ncbi:MAG TPA: hypothetical protein K8V90_01040 [Romboutsia timonensis]|uniref:Uncharacterized protein n=4 Tax=Peptostreptococcaceae TaxID=186804 RepID=A0A921MZQ4_9FIRM|nr:hypothetical protein [Romboutsia timonensis]
MFEYLKIPKEEYTINIITMWSIVQGMSSLIANKNIVTDCDYESIIENILKNKLKFD